jgi:hypothetical protein
VIRIPGTAAARARLAEAELARQLAAAEAARRQAWPVWIWLPRISPAIPSTPSGCGCGRA